MSIDSVDDARSEAIEHLEQFGLSAYAARTFVALTTFGSGTATEISEISNVPRTRVYDAVDELQERGLVDVQQSSPKQFWAVSAETAQRILVQEIEHRTDRLNSALNALGPRQQKHEQQGVWTVDDQPAVTDRVLEFVRGADDEIVYMTVEELLTDDIIDALAAAADRGVTIRLAGISSDVQELIREDVPGVELFDSMWLWSDTPAGRLMMVDREQTLVSVIVNGKASPPSDPRSETAIWGAGETNSLVVVLRTLFTWRLEHDEVDD
ncbi:MULTISPECIES: TrmB family transcriptional regulator [Haloferax]|uniref:TrmB family transcriptional regulator n=1 Tax=Haloferax marinum TaxID=2666143 RepID=A0A6A8G9P6_9EURY|nr:MULTISPECIES: helix-turn-helix domain-containing protein [Haloferax]KAB1198799.1 TrmB family transcriptional regulator [Haloferax sp. CBA1150]MRW97919.1 TrmB family transcriptional regulator [Haloferax marinum]